MTSRASTTLSRAPASASRMALVARATSSHHHSGDRTGRTVTCRGKGRGATAGGAHRRRGVDRGCVGGGRWSSPIACRRRSDPTPPRGSPARSLGRDGTAARRTPPVPCRASRPGHPPRWRRGQPRCSAAAPVPRHPARPAPPGPARAARRRGRPARAGRGPGRPGECGRRARSRVGCLASRGDELGDADRQQAALDVREAGGAELRPASHRARGGRRPIGAGSGRRPGRTGARRPGAPPCRSRRRGPSEGTGSVARPPRGGRCGPRAARSARARRRREGGWRSCAGRTRR